MDTPNKDVLLKAVADVLQEALNEFDTISKMPEQPAAPATAEAPLAKFDIQASEDPSKAAPAAASDEKDEDDKDEDKKDEDEKDKDEDDKDDETLKSEFAALQKKMEARGLLKSEPAKVEAAAAPAAEAPKAPEAVQKSETTAEAPKAEEKSEELKKAFDTIDSLQKTIADLSAKVEKIGAAPAARRGAAGYAPALRKNAEGSAEGSTEGFNLTKSQVIDKLIELKKSGKAVDTALINRIETNRYTEQDARFIKGLLG